MLIEVVSLLGRSVKQKIDIKVKPFDLFMQVEGGDVFDSLDDPEYDYTPKKITHLYDNNSYLDVKRFVFLEFGIPIECQHLQSKKGSEWVNPCYEYRHVDASLAHMVYPIDITDLSHESSVGGIPIDMVFMSNRSSYTSIDKSFKRLKPTPVRVRVYDLREALELGEVRHFLSKDKDNKNTFHQGFVDKFFPMIIEQDYVFSKSVWLPYANALPDKLQAMNSISKAKGKKPLSEPLAHMDSINIRYKHHSRARLHILKLYNSIDLNDADKLEAYLPKQGKYLMKILKNDFGSELSEQEGGHLSYIKIFFEDSYIKLFENNDIDSFISSEGSTKQRLLSVYRSLLAKVLAMFPSVDTLSAAKHYKILSTCFTLTYATPGNMHVTKQIEEMVSRYDDLEEYKMSAATSYKDAITMYTNRKNVSKDYETLRTFISGKRLPFSSSSSISIVPGINDLSVSFSNILLKEVPVRVEFVNRIIGSLKTSSSGHAYASSNSKIKILKSSDPALFDIPDQNYSRICQSNLQPIIVDKNTKGSVKYWNFTHGVPAYYKCDSKKYPHLKFVTGHHPKGYCLPCCKKKEVENSSQYKLKHDTCLKTFKYFKVNDSKSSRYIALYSPKVEIESNKLMNISNTMKKIFNAELYILGVAPFRNTIENYTLTCLSKALYGTYDNQVDVLLRFVDLIRSDTYLFYNLMNGTLVAYFSKAEDLATFLRSLTDPHGIHTSKWISFIDWEELFCEMAEHMGVGIVHIHEEDNKTVSDSQLFLRKSSKPFDKYLYLIHRKKTMRYPIVSLNVREYFYSGNIESILMDASLMPEVHVQSRDQIGEEIASFTNSKQQVFAKCFKRPNGSYLIKTVDYMYSKSPGKQLLKFLKDRSVTSRMEDVLAYTSISKWIKYGDLFLGVDGKYMYFVNGTRDIPGATEMTSSEKSRVPSEAEVKNALYETNMYNLLLLHVSNLMSSMKNEKIRSLIKKDPLGSKKLISESDYRRIQYKLELSGNLDFMELERFDFDSLEVEVSNIVDIREPNFDMPIDKNFGICVSTEYYCNGSKFLLKNGKYLDVLKQDLDNDYKRKFIEQFTEITGVELYIQEYTNSKTIIYGA